MNIFNELKEKNIVLTNLKIIIEFAMSLPGTNAVVERIFSLMNKIWTAEKTQLTIKTLKFILITKHNFELIPVESF